MMTIFLEPLSAMALATAQTTTSIQALNMAAQQILAAPPLSSSAAPSLASDEAQAQADANLWLTQLEPATLQLLAAVTQTCVDFLNTEYPQLVSLADGPQSADSQEQFTNILNTVMSSISTEQDDAATLYNSLSLYQTQIATDVGNFTEDSQELSNAIAGDQAEISSLQSEIDTLQHQINVANGVESALNGLSWFFGIFTHEILKVVEDLINNWVLDLNDKENAIEQDNQSISEEQSDIQQLTALTNNLSGLINGSTLLVTGMNTLTAGLATMEGYLKNIQDDSAVQIGPFLDPELETLQQAFEDTLQSIQQIVGNQ